jgi:SAM-dependent methyltransferase
MGDAAAAGSADIARYYDLDVAHERDDIDMYLALASGSDGPILELACGTGRICVPVAAAGYDVTGVDVDAAMLDRARAKWREQTSWDGSRGSLTLVERDVTQMDFGRRFDLAILGFNSLLVIGNGKPAAQRAALAAMARHLTRDGRAVIDTWLPDDEDLEVYDGRVIREWTRVDPETRAQVVKSVSATFDRKTRRAVIDTHFEAAGERVPASTVSRRDEVYFPTRDELLEMIEAAGLVPQQVVGAYDMSPLERDSERVIVVAAIGHSAPDSVE